MTIEFRQITSEHLPVIRQSILDIHAEVRLRDFGLTGPFYDVARFDERLSVYASRPGWTAVIGYEDDEPVGFCFGMPLGADTKWWSAMTEPLPREYLREDGKRTLALNEIVVRKPWRGRGVAWQIHEAWLSTRTEDRGPSHTPGESRRRRRSRTSRLRSLGVPEDRRTKTIPRLSRLRVDDASGTVRLIEPAAR